MNLFEESLNYFAHTLRWNQYVYEGKIYYQYYLGTYNKRKYQDSGDGITAFKLKCFHGWRPDLTKNFIG